jgi:hypothetical protein
VDPWGRVGAIKQKRYTDEQIAIALSFRQAESGTAVAETFRKIGFRPGSLNAVQGAVAP